MTVLFSDGFESNDFSAWDKAQGTQGGSLSTGTDYKYAGSYGACLYGHGSGGTAEIHLDTESLSGTDLWFSFWWKPVSCDYPDGTQRAMMIFYDEDSNQTFNLTWGTIGTNKQFRMLHKTNPAGGAWVQTQLDDPATTLGTWYFIEAHLSIGAGDGNCQIFVDGVCHMDLTNISNDDYAAFAKCQHYLAATTSETVERHMDDFTVSTSRIYPPRGFKVYHNSGIGPIDYDTIRDAYASNITDWTSDVLTYPNTWRLGVRAYNEYGEEKNVAVAEELALLDSGEESPARPNRPAGVAAVPAEDGKVELTFSHDATGEAAVCTHFHVCYDAGSGEIEYANPLGSVDKDDGPLTHYAFLSDALTDGQTYRFAVRAATAEDVEDDGIEFVEVTADAQAPAQPESLTGVVVR